MVSFHVLRCAQCSTFQVLQVTKSQKWKCKLCGEKQSIIKVYGEGTGAECRQHVQKLNRIQGELSEAASNSYESLATTQPAVNDMQQQSSGKQPSRWSSYIEDFKEGHNRNDEEENMRNFSENSLRVTTDWAEYNQGQGKPLSYKQRRRAESDHDKTTSYQRWAKKDNSQATTRINQTSSRGCPYPRPDGTQLAIQSNSNRPDIRWSSLGQLRQTQVGSVIEETHESRDKVHRKTSDTKFTPNASSNFRVLNSSQSPRFKTGYDTALTVGLHSSEEERINNRDMIFHANETFEEATVKRCMASGRSASREVTSSRDTMTRKLSSITKPALSSKWAAFVEEEAEKEDDSEDEWNEVLGGENVYTTGHSESGISQAGEVIK